MSASPYILFVPSTGCEPTPGNCSPEDFARSRLFSCLTYRSRPSSLCFMHHVFSGRFVSVFFGMNIRRMVDRVSRRGRHNNRYGNDERRAVFAFQSRHRDILALHRDDTRNTDVETCQTRFWGYMVVKNVGSLAPKGISPGGCVPTLFSLSTYRKFSRHCELKRLLHAVSFLCKCCTIKMLFSVAVICFKFRIRNNSRSIFIRQFKHKRSIPR